MLSRLGVTLGALGLVTGGLALGTPAQAERARRLFHTPLTGSC